MIPYRFSVASNSRTSVFACGLLPGEHYELWYVHNTDCSSGCAEPFTPNGCPSYLGKEFKNAGNPLILDATATGDVIAGTYELRPAADYGADVKLYTIVEMVR